VLWLDGAHSVVVDGAIAVVVALVPFVVVSGLWSRADGVVRIVSITACDSNTRVVDAARRRVVGRRGTVVEAAIAGRTLC